MDQPIEAAEAAKRLHIIGSHFLNVCVCAVDLSSVDEWERELLDAYAPASCNEVTAGEGASSRLSRAHLSPVARRRATGGFVRTKVMEHAANMSHKSLIGC